MYNLLVDTADNCHGISIFSLANAVHYEDKRPAEQRDIFRQKLFYNEINWRLKKSQCTMKMQSSKKKVLIHLRAFLEQTPTL